MFAATAVAVADKLVTYKTGADITSMPFMVIILTAPAAPPVNVTLPVDTTAIGVLLVIIELL